MFVFISLSMHKKILFRGILVIIIIVVVGTLGYLYAAKNKGLKQQGERVEVDPKHTAEVDERIKRIETEIANTPEDSNLWRALGLQYYVKGDLIPAKDKLEKAIALNPDNYLAYSILGDVTKEMGDFVVAEQNYRKAISRNPLYKNGYIKLADFYRMREVNKQSEAGAVLEQAIQNTNDSFFIKQYAIWLEEQGNIRGAIDYWKEAQKREPENTQGIQEDIERLEKMLEDGVNTSSSF